MALGLDVGLVCAHRMLEGAGMGLAGSIAAKLSRSRNSSPMTHSVNLPTGAAMAQAIREVKVDRSTGEVTFPEAISRPLLESLASDPDVARRLSAAR